MVFSRLFGKSAPPPEAPDADAADDAPEDITDEGVEEEHPSFGERAGRVIVGGASSGSKRMGHLWGKDAVGPSHFVRAAGCHVVTSEGDTLVDCTMALGSVALGYAEPELTRVVVETLANGPVSGLSPVLEVEVAERLCGVVPCAERVLFLKTGADAVSAAVRIARTHTGRDLVIGCGYFGWHDWWSEAEGVPEGVRRNFRKIPFDDVAALERTVSDAGASLAAIIIEPVIERMPSREWIVRARELADAAGAVLIFDEMKTGFRLATGGYQQYADVTPDLATFGKALANGYPLSVVCGHASLMEVAEKQTWISATLASEAGSLAAAAAVLAWHDRADICGSLASIGKEMREVVGNALAASGVGGVSLQGIDPMWFLRFDDPARESLFLRAAARNGVLFKKGAYNYAAMAHDEDAMAAIEGAASAAFVEVRERDAR